MQDIERSLVSSVCKLLRLFPCVAVLGARQTGKTTLLSQVLPNAPRFDLEKSSDYETITTDPLFFLTHQPCPLILDEAQLCPDLFKALRVKIDENRSQKGQFLLSGSSSPELLHQISESLAGRIAIIELGGLTWSEATNNKSSSIYEILLNNNFDDLTSLKPKHTLDQLFELCLLGGYPEPFLNRETPQFYDLWIDNYLQTYINRDIRRLFPGLNMENYQRFIKMMAFSSGEIIKVSDFANSLDVSQPTAKNYFEIAAGTFIWRSLPSYQKNLKKRVLKMAKGFLRDTGIITHLNKINNIDDLRTHPKFGYIWEVFVIEQLIKKFQMTLEHLDFYYYRTADHSEIDLIIESKNMLIPVEIKTGGYRGRKQIQSLINFVDDNNCQYGIIINNETNIIRLSESIYQIPATYW